MPWGPHKGIPMMQVDPTWLLWLFRQPWIKEWPDIYDYLESRSENLSKVEVETLKGEPQGEFTSYDDYMRYGRD